MLYSYVLELCIFSISYYCEIKRSEVNKDPCISEHLFATALRSLKFSGLRHQASLHNCIKCVQNREDQSLLHYRLCIVKTEVLANKGFSNISQIFASTKHRHLITAYMAITSRAINAAPVAHG